METKQQFKTADGMIFYDQPSAEKHEMLLNLTKEYHDAKNRLGKFLVESQMTIDNEPFKLGITNNYYFIVYTNSGEPYLKKVWFGGGNSYIDVDSDVVCITLEEDNRKHSYRINELYHHKKNAEKALLIEMEKYHDFIWDQIKKLRSKINYEYK